MRGGGHARWRWTRAAESRVITIGLANGNGDCQSGHLAHTCVQRVAEASMSSVAASRHSIRIRVCTLRSEGVLGGVEGCYSERSGEEWRRVQGVRSAECGVRSAE